MNKQPTRQERDFGRSVGVVLTLIAAYQLVRGRRALGEVMGSLGVLLAVLGTFAPRALVLPSRYWWKFAHALGWFNSRVLLGLFYGCIITPLGMVWRATGRDPLTQRPASTTWVDYPAGRRDAKHYEHIF